LATAIVVANFSLLLDNSHAASNYRNLSTTSQFSVHPHEAANGRTSCISQHILGFDFESKAIYPTVPASASSAQKSKSWKSMLSCCSSSFSLFCVSVLFFFLPACQLSSPNRATSSPSSIFCVVTNVDMCPEYSRANQETARQDLAFSTRPQASHCYS
jgi:hypothetical protein